MYSIAFLVNSPAILAEADGLFPINEAPTKDEAKTSQIGRAHV